MQKMQGRAASAEGGGARPVPADEWKKAGHSGLDQDFVDTVPLPEESRQVARARRERPGAQTLEPSIRKRIAFSVIGVMCVLLLQSRLLRQEVDDYLKPEFQKKIEVAADRLGNGESTIVVIDGATSVCFQGPNMTEEEYEKVADRNIDGFRFIESDAKFGLHVFFQDLPDGQAQFGDHMIRMDKAQLDEACKETSYIQLERRDGFVLAHF